MDAEPLPNATYDADVGTCIESPRIEDACAGPCAGFEDYVRANAPGPHEREWNTSDWRGFFYVERCRAQDGAPYDAVRSRRSDIDWWSGEVAIFDVDGAMVFLDRQTGGSFVGQYCCDGFLSGARAWGAPVVLECSGAGTFDYSPADFGLTTASTSTGDTGP